MHKDIIKIKYSLSNIINDHYVQKLGEDKKIISLKILIDLICNLNAPFFLFINF